MRILFASMPADGHFHPLTGIAVHLAGRGHDVRWYAGPEYAPKAEALGFECFPYRRATEVTGDNLNVLFPERERLKGPKLISFDLEKFFVANVAHHFDDVREIHDGEFPFEALICDGAFYAEKLVAERLGVPVFAVGIPMVLPDADAPPPFFGLAPARGLRDRLVHAVVRRMLTSTVKAGTLAYNEVLAAHDLEPIPLDGFPHFPMASARRIFLNGSPGLEFPGYRPMPNAEFVGALVPARRALGADAGIPVAVTDPAARVVVVSQGTVDNTEPEKLIVPALKGLAGEDFVVVATTGGARTEQLRRRFGGDRVVVADFINYDDLFPHADVFVTNGGYGSVLAAMRHGVPVVAAGKREGKNDINVRLAHNGLGVDLRSEHPKPARIRAAVAKVLAEPSYAANVARVRAELSSLDPFERIESAVAALETVRS